MSFAVQVERVLKHEGGFVDHPADPGGATNFGITERVARGYGYKGDMRSLPRATAIAIYKAQYWNAVRGDELPPALAGQVFDAAVNHGVGNASRWLQQAVEITADGKIGPKTVAAAKGVSEADAIMRFNAIRLDFYASLKTFATFGKGWTRRVAGKLREAANDLGE